MVEHRRAKGAHVALIQVAGARAASPQVDVIQRVRQKSFEQIVRRQVSMGWSSNRSASRLFKARSAALRDPVLRAYCDRKIAQGKRHNQSLIALARRRCDVLFAMLRDGTLYETKHALAAGQEHREIGRASCRERV